MRISLVIPTRERARYLAGCLDAALSISDPDLEIVITDNRSRDDTADVVAARKQPRLLYTRTSERCSMRANFEHGLRAASGDYVVFIGDDDGVLPEGFAHLRELLERRRPEAVAWRLIQYVWPSDRMDSRSGCFSIKASLPYRGTTSQSCSEILDRACAARLRSYRDAANIYHGCVSRGLIEKVRAAQGGIYFRGAIPDVYASMANLREMSSPLIWAGYPATFGGVSPRSNGASQMSRSRVPKAGLEEISAFKQEASHDAGAASIDVSIPSVEALTLDMLDMALSGTPDHARIDRKAWLRRIRRRLARMPRPKYAHGAAALETYCREKGLEDMLRAVESETPFAGPEEAPDRNPPQTPKLKAGKITLADPVGLGTVAHASRVIDEVLGGRRFDSGMRWINWLTALQRARGVARRWRAEPRTGA